MKTKRAPDVALRSTELVNNLFAKIPTALSVPMFLIGLVCMWDQFLASEAQTIETKSERGLFVVLATGAIVYLTKALKLTAIQAKRLQLVGMIMLLFPWSLLNHAALIPGALGLATRLPGYLLATLTLALQALIGLIIGVVSIAAVLLFIAGLGSSGGSNVRTNSSNTTSAAPPTAEKKSRFNFRI
jgi:hypothetical protein